MHPPLDGALINKSVLVVTLNIIAHTAGNNRKLIDLKSEMARRGINAVCVSE